MHINGIVLLNTISRYILFGTGSMIKYRKTENIEDGIKQVKELYLKRGFKITRIHADSEFEPIHPEVDELDISLICVSKTEHVTDIE